MSTTANNTTSQRRGRHGRRAPAHGRGVPAGVRIRRLLAAGAILLYCAAPSTLRPLFQLLATPGPYAQRAEALAQTVIRVDALSHFLRRS